MTEAREIQPKEDLPAVRSGPLALTPQEVKQQYDQLVELQKSVLREGADYGVIPGTGKPSLWKPGAEKVLKLYAYRLGPTEIIQAEEDWQRPFFAYTVRVTLVGRTGEVVGDGIGSANLLERRYQRRTCQERHKHRPECYEPHTSDTLDYTVANTLLKMARKRALVDAVLVSTMASDLFTQDVEDYETPPSTEDGGGGNPASRKQLDFLENLRRKHKMTEEEFVAVIRDRTGHDPPISSTEAHHLIDEMQEAKPVVSKGGAEPDPEADADAAVALSREVKRMAEAEWSPSGADADESEDPESERVFLLHQMGDLIGEYGWTPERVREILGSDKRKNVTTVLVDADLLALREHETALQEAAAAEEGGEE